MQKFVNLHGHTYGSLLDAIIRPAELVKQAQKLGYTAVAVTDHGNMSQIFPVYTETLKTYQMDGKKPIPGTGLKLIPGNEIYYCEDLTDPKAKRRHLVLLASNAQGYRNLCRVTYEGFLNSVTVMGKQFPRVDEAILRKYSEGLFCTSACGGSIIAAAVFAGDMEEAKRQASIFKDIYQERFFIELQPHTLSRGEFGQVHLNNSLKTVAEELGIEMVATCDSHYLTTEDEKYHDMVLAISAQKSLSDPTRHRYVTTLPCEFCNGAKCSLCAHTGVGELVPCPEFYIKTEDEIRKFFTEHYDAEFAEKLIDNTAKIGAACVDPFYLEPTGEHIPQFDMRMIKGEPDEQEFIDWLDSKPERKEVPVPNAFMRFRVAKAYREYMKKNNFDKKTQKKYWDRILFELDILESKGFCSYMLVVADAINWCAKNDVWTGTARGSAAGSLTAYLLGIHKVDPIEYNLLFERFQSKERPACPDIDSDIESAGRDRLLAYMKERWGAEYTCQITNVNKITPKVALKDIAKSLEIGGSRQESFALADKITKTVPLKVTLPDTDPDNPGKTIEIRTMDLARKHSPGLEEFLVKYPEVASHAEKIVGLPRSWGVHAGGIVVSDKALPDFMPMRRDNEKIVSVAYDKDVAEKNGLIKIDMLGLDTIDVLKAAYKSANKIGIKIPVPWECPEDDKNVYDMIGRGDVLGLFQLEGGTLAKLCKPIKPKNITDISLINALGRPGISKEKREQFIRRRNGKEEIVFAHEELRAIQAPTLGISTYDEDLLRISQHIAGWSLSKADGLRKLTKMKEKGADLAIKLEKDFVNDAEKLGRVTRDEAQMIWDVVIADYAKYGFCLSHSISYSKIGYQTAYYKYHAKAPFLCAYLNQEISKKTPATASYIEKIKKEILASGISIRACDISQSGQGYTVIDKKTIVTGLNAIAGVGEAAQKAIFLNQPYKSFPDFLYRSPSAVNKTVIVALAKAGAFDCFNISRKWIHDVFTTEEGKMGKKLRDAVNKFGDKACGAGTESETDARLIDWSEFDWKVSTEGMKDEWELREILIAEKAVIGEFISGTADTVFKDFFKNTKNPIKKSSLAFEKQYAKVVIEGILLSADEITIKNGKNAGSTMGRVVVESLRKEDFEISLFKDSWARYKSDLLPGLPVRMICSVKEYNGDPSLSLELVEEIWKV